MYIISVKSRLRMHAPAFSGDRGLSFGLSLNHLQTLQIQAVKTLAWLGVCADSCETK